MPRSKRNKLVSLTATAKKPLRENNARLFEQIQESVDTYLYIFVFSVDNMRNTYLKDVRSQFSDSRLFFGKTKVMAKALGSDASTELRPGLSELSSHLSGNVGLIFTPRPPTEIVPFFEEYRQSDYARMGHIAPEEFVVPQGIVCYDSGEPLPHSMETTVRGLGMPTKLQKGKVWLDQEYVVCREGDKLDARAAGLLKAFGRETAEFRVKITAWWGKEEEKVSVVESEEME